jgi:HK97 family phage prohead protease
VKGKLLLDTVAGREAYTRLKAGLVKALSVGFQLPSEGFSRKDGIRVITRAVLKEISLVIFGANALAAGAAVKEETPQSPLKPLLGWL